MFLTHGTGDDPPIYRWSESSEYRWTDPVLPVPVFDSLWDFLHDVLEDESRP